MKVHFIDGGLEIEGLDDRLQHIEKALQVQIHDDQANYDLKACAERKGQPLSTISSDPLMQPQIGYTNRRWGKKKYYSRETVEAWLNVFEADIPDYIKGLLTSEDRDVALGVQAQLIRLRSQGRVPNELWREVRDLLTIKGVA